MLLTGGQVGFPYSLASNQDAVWTVPSPGTQIVLVGGAVAVKATPLGAEPGGTGRAAQAWRQPGGPEVFLTLRAEIANRAVSCRATKNDRKRVRRFDEPWHLLLEWTMGQPSERMAALILDEEGFENIDPAHPLGEGQRRRRTYPEKRRAVGHGCVLPRGQQSISEITDKLTSDVEKAKSKTPTPVNVAFVTNQELRLAERETLRKVGGDTKVNLYHLERVTTVLDRPHMAGAREQFLGIPAGPSPILVTAGVIGHARTFLRGDEMLSALVDIEEKAFQRRNEELRANPPDPVTAWRAASVMRSMGYDASEEPAQPLSDAQIAEHVATLRRDAEGRWASCLDYLASICWPALRFRITNQAQSFLTNVQVILTFHSAGALEFEDIDTLEWEKLKDPDWEPQPYGPFGTIPPMNFKVGPTTRSNGKTTTMGTLR